MPHNIQRPSYREANVGRLNRIDSFVLLIRALAGRAKTRESRGGHNHFLQESSSIHQFSRGGLYCPSIRAAHGRYKNLIKMMLRLSAIALFARFVQCLYIDGAFFHSQLWRIRR